MKFEIIEDQAGGWYFHIASGNGKVLAHSEGYTRRRDAVRAAKRVREGAATADIVLA